VCVCVCVCVCVSVCKMEQQDAALNKELDQLKQKKSLPGQAAAGVAAVGANRALETEVLQLRQHLKKAEELGTLTRAVLSCYSYIQRRTMWVFFLLCCAVLCGESGRLTWGVAVLCSGCGAQGLEG
jgi:hypothetical protein